MIHKEILANVLTYHWPTKTSGCCCGWSELGKSFPEHVIEVYEQAIVDEFDRCARAYGWEIGRGHPITEKLETTEDNPFTDPNWRETHGLVRPSEGSD